MQLWWYAIRPEVTALQTVSTHDAFPQGSTHGSAHGSRYSKNAQLSVQSITPPSTAPFLMHNHWLIAEGRIGVVSAHGVRFPYASTWGRLIVQSTQYGGN